MGVHFSPIFDGAALHAPTFCTHWLKGLCALRGIVDSGRTFHTEDQDMKLKSSTQLAQEIADLQRRVATLELALRETPKVSA